METAPSPVKITIAGGVLSIDYTAPGVERANHAVFVALDTDPAQGSAALPGGAGTEGSGVWLPFRADRLYSAQLTSSGAQKTMRLWKDLKWSDRMDVKPEFDVKVEPGVWHFTVRLAELGKPTRIGVAVYAKNLAENDGSGAMLPSEQVSAGIGDKYVRGYFEVEGGAITARTRLATGERPRIYQLLPRVFGNGNETRKPGGTLAENGCGKFADINDAALRSLKDIAFTHLWLTGVLRHATSTEYPGLPADEPSIVKGVAGSPYAIRDCFDVCPDYATEPGKRLAEFQALLGRIHAAGLRAIIDFVPNHVARSHRSTVKPELSFGAKDNPAKFFDPANNFFWLQPDSPGGGPPLRLPTDKGGGLFAPETKTGRVTGNNVASWSPGAHDWYETVKLNYGYDFTTKKRAYPHAEKPAAPVPDTWLKMDAVLAHWQRLGVDGFRCDMAHIVPPEFWAWAIARARARQPGVFFLGEAYDNDPMKVGTGNVMHDLLSAGFNAVYDDPTYKTLKNIHDGVKWANDLDGVLAAADREYFFHNALRYAENHDEVRLAGAGQWGGIGAEVGRPVSAILYGVGRGPVLLHSGQEVGEPAAGAEGHGGDDARTTIFDYWSMPELVKWVNGHAYDGAQLSAPQRELRAFYSRLLHLTGEPAFRDGEFFGLNPANGGNPRFGRLAGETASGHWLYAFLRHDAASGQRFLVVANLHRSEPLADVRVQLPPAAAARLGIRPGTTLVLTERLAAGGLLKIPVPAADMLDAKAGIGIGSIPPLTAFYFEIHEAKP